MSDTVMIVNAAKADARAAAELHERVARAFAEKGRPKPRLVMTTPEDNGATAAGSAVESGAEFVVACGGDGTVNAVAEALGGTGVVLGILPLGTGNLLAGQLCIPSALDEAIAVLLEGSDRRIDLGVVGDRVFVGMAGLGLDAAMIADASERLKARVGWPAYVPSILRHLRDRGERVTLRVDGRRVRHRHVKALIIGNHGRLHGGIDLMPAAEPDDGLLDVIVLEPYGRLWGWLGVLVRIVLRRDGPYISRYRAKQVEARVRRPVPLELDGDPYRTATLLSVQVRPGALLVRTPESRQPSDPLREAGIRL
ncbi:diacylglycerol/lipid kinase family protein [Actinocrinis sp.]|uniref:diacylglycerol/lipid kinase family protein n=1 Tax=Actinocrinis sp. TaxID=1920516 RepID=UPI002D41446B|nr:diacylglycerol kinase family protein [Actinocrinis sp.]HZP51288.1 diacylglycerol kinase family protein [Actinocrinis sp.]